MNVKKFKIKLAENDKRLEDISEYLTCNIATLYRKMNGDSDFTCAEIKEIATFLNLTQSEVNVIFFDEKLA